MSTPAPVERITATAIAPTVLHQHPDGTPLDDDHVAVALDAVVIEGTHDEIRTLLTGVLALIDHDARSAVTAAAPDGRDDDYTAEALDRTVGEDDPAAARADRLTWSPGDITITPPPTGGDQ